MISLVAQKQRQGKAAATSVQVLGQDFDQGSRDHDIQCAILQGRRNTVYSSTEMEKYSCTLLF